MSELKKCPFCGGKAVLCNSGNYSETTFYWIYCKECGCKQPSSIHLESVTKAWNNRKPVEDVLERLKKKIKPLHNVNWNVAMEEAIEIIKEVLN